MICFRDMAFCSAPCSNHACPRKLTERLMLQAREWWGGPDAPIAWADMSEGCPDLIPVEN